MLIETIPAAFEMDAILYELRDYGCALNAGRWDYIFSTIKKLGAVLPDRAQVTMTVPFMRAYTELLVRSCHRRGAHAIGGMAAFIPSRRDPEVNEVALARVRDDKLRESGDGFDGTWVAHPDLVPVATEVFDGVLGVEPEPARPAARGRRGRRRRRSSTSTCPGGEITDAGLRANVSVGARYLDAWLARHRRSGDRQPDGGRRDRRDLALAGVELGQRRASSARTTSAASSTQIEAGARGEAALRRGRARPTSCPSS